MLTAPAWAQDTGSGVYGVTGRGTWTVPATGDTDGILLVQQQLLASFPSATFSDASAVVSPIQSVPGSTTFDVTVEFTVTSPALTLSTSLSGVTFKSLGTALLKAGRIKGTNEQPAQP